MQCGLHSRPSGLLGFLVLARSHQPYASRTSWLPASIFKLIPQFLGCFIMRIILAYHLTFPGIAHRVTCNPFCYCKGSFDMYYQGAISTDTGCVMMFGCYRFSHLPWLEHKLASDPMLWGSDAPIVQASLLPVEPWTVIADGNTPLGLDAQIRAIASQCLLLDVQVFHRQFFGNMMS